MQAQMRALGEPGFDPMAIPRFDPATVPVESAAFDYQGRPLSTQDTSVDNDAWIVDVPIRGTTTLYQRIGDLFGWLCLAGTVVLIVVGVRARRSAS
ncbi:hypothetical protein [Nocardia brasiliensis]|uniref:hypothetical protein n=1 Tax=Nocardia brasiliensis TaxID=37326 RepID=UPI0024566C7A|nr:hypothetical protein [Nocardia brasiliensis]